jgi:hypothetical protein
MATPVRAANGLVLVQFQVDAPQTCHKAGEICGLDDGIAAAFVEGKHPDKKVSWARYLTQEEVDVLNAATAERVKKSNEEKRRLAAAARAELGMQPAAMIIPQPPEPEKSAARK